MLQFRSGVLGCPWLILGAFCLMPTGPAESAEPWVRIEEDWTLALNEPDSRTHSPQITFYLTPHANQEQTYFQFQLNHAADAEFSGGGFRVDAFQQNESTDRATSLTRAALNVSDDVINWTFVMAVQDQELLFAVKNGQSQSWGAFGGPEYLLRMPANGIENLAHYTPRRSVADVDLGFGRNRIKYLRLERVRAYRKDGTIVSVVTNFAAH